MAVPAQPNALVEAPGRPSEGSQITCKLVTSLPAPYRVSESPVALPASITRYGLSQVVNQLLALDAPKPFDFLVGQELVRASLESILLNKRLSTEAVLQVQYVLAAVPPKLDRELLHLDWVDAVDGSRPSCILSGTCDGRLHCWTGSGQELSSTALHTRDITALTALPTSQGPLLLSAGKDHVVRLSQLSALEDEGSTEQAQTLAVYRGHTDAVQCLAAAPSGSFFCSGSWDSSVRLWRTGRSIADEGRQAAPTGARKRQKQGDTSNAAAAGGIEKEADHVLTGHTQCVAGVAWPAESSLVSCSWDHSARSWDVEASAEVTSLNTSHALYCTAVQPEQPSTAAVAGAGKAIRIWDCRLPGSVQAEGAKNLKSHTQWITALHWHPSNANQLLSASHDKTLKVWDLRASLPLYTLQGHTEGVLCAAWLAGGGIASGGADSMLRLWQETAV